MNPYQSIDLDRDKKEHLYLQLFKALEVMIASGRLRPHQKLPPIRKLAELLDVNNVTIVNAYKLLEEGSLVYKKVGSGTFVTPQEEEVQADALVSNARQNQTEISFAQSSPTADLFPVSDFKMVLNEVLDRDKGMAFSYQASWGYSPLRESVVDYLKDSNIHVEPDVIQVISGAQQGIDIVSKAILNYGDYVLVEAPSYTGAIAAFKMKGANIIEVPMAQDGIHIEAFKEAVKKYKPKLFYTMPNLQNPTGYTYSLEKKKAVLEVAAENRLWILEDDYASDLFFHDEEGKSLKCLDTVDRVIYIKSFSKIYMPGLRLGFMAAPKRLGQELVVAKHITDISTSGLIQRAFDLYLRRGLWKQQIDSMRRIFKERYDAAVIAIDSYMPNDCSYHQPEGGLNFWIQMPAYLNADSFAQYAHGKGIEIVSGSAFYFTQGKSHCFRISVAGVYLEQIDPWIEKLMETLNEYIESHSNREGQGIDFIPVL